MEVHIIDAGALRRITPVLLRTYLEVRGWSRQEAWKDRIVVWSKATNTGKAEVHVPLREQSDTYAVRISEAFAVLAQLEERSQLDVYYDVIGAGADIIKFRPMLGRTRQDWSLEDSADLFSRMKELLLAAARTAESPGRPVYHGRSSALVQDYVRELRTVPGFELSEELSIYSPVPVEYGTQADLGDPFNLPFPRQVTQTLNRSLGVTARTAEAVLGGEDIETFDSVATQGVSANICEAVAALTRHSGGMEMTVAWAPLRQSEVSGGHFSFAGSVADVLGQGADHLRQKHPFLDVLVQGEIVRLDRQSQEDFDGQAVVLAEVEGKTTPLDVQFAKSDRDEVLRAFWEKLQIRVYGDIHRERKRHQLKNLRDFAVIRNAPSEPTP